MLNGTTQTGNCEEKKSEDDGNLTSSIKAILAFQAFKQYM